MQNYELMAKLGKAAANAVVCVDSDELSMAQTLTVDIDNHAGKVFIVMNAAPVGLWICEHSERFYRLDELVKVLSEASENFDWDGDEDLTPQLKATLGRVRSEDELQGINQRAAALEQRNRELEHTHNELERANEALRQSIQAGPAGDLEKTLAEQLTAAKADNSDLKKGNEELTAMWREQGLRLAALETTDVEYLQDRLEAYEKDHQKVCDQLLESQNEVKRLQGMVDEHKDSLKGSLARIQELEHSIALEKQHRKAAEAQLETRDKD